MPRSVLIVEDHPPTTLGLCTLVRRSPNFAVLGVVKDGAEAIERVRAQQPDVVCLDLGLAGVLDGFGACRAMVALEHPPAVVVYTAREEPGIAARAGEAGACAVVAKSESHVELTSALAHAARGKPYLSPLLARAAATAPAVSPRQREVLALLAEGLDNRAIGERTGVSAETVKTHVKEILSKLGASHRWEAVAIGLRGALIG